MWRSDKLFGVEPDTVIAKYLVFRIVFREHAELPMWKGNLLRGAIGSVLPKICGRKKFDCMKCSIWTQCPYGYLYRARSKGIVLKNIKGISKPFVLKPPLNRDEVFEEGDELVFSIILFGDSIRFERDIILSILRLSEKGLGKKSSRGRFNVEEITAVNPYRGIEYILYRDRVVYDAPTLITYKDLVGKAEEITKGKKIKIRFQTPVRLLSRNNVLLPIELVNIVKYGMRRFTNILAQYTYTVPDIPVHQILENTMKTELVELEIERTVLKYRGVPEEYYIGEITFEGKIDLETATILSFGELAHIGKRASYGHGWYKILLQDKPVERTRVS